VLARESACRKAKKKEEERRMKARGRGRKKKEENGRKRKMNHLCLLNLTFDDCIKIVSIINRKCFGSFSMDFDVLI
jgi:hypothetical protein